MLYNLNNIDKIFYNNKEYSSMYSNNKEIWYNYLEEPIFVTIKNDYKEFELYIVKNNEIINKTNKESVADSYDFCENFNINNVVQIKTCNRVDMFSQKNAENFYNIKNDGNYSIDKVNLDDNIGNLLGDPFLQYGSINGIFIEPSSNYYHSVYYKFYYKGKQIFYFNVAYAESNGNIDEKNYYSPSFFNCQFRNMNKFDNEADNYFVVSKLENKVGYPVQKVIKIKDDNYEVLDGENSIFKNKYIKIVKLLDGNSIAKKAYYQNNWIFEYCILDKDYNEITIENKYNLINSIGDSIGMELYRDENYIYFYNNDSTSTKAIINITDKDCNTLINTINFKINYSNCRIVKWKNNRLFAIRSTYDGKNDHSAVCELNLSPESITYGNNLLSNNGILLNILC